MDGMKIGLQYNTGITKKEIREAGLDILGAEYDELFFAGGANVVRISASKLEQAVLDGALEDLFISGTKVLVIETVGISSADEAGKLSSLLLKCIPGFKAKDITVCIENGFIPDGERIYRGPLGDGTALAAFIDELNRKAGEEFFGAAFNTGCARVLRLQLTEHVKALGNRIRVLYLSDNDGKNDLRQLPYTFTTVHGTNCAGWDELIGIFKDQPQDVFIMEDVRGTFAVCPQELKGTFLQLAKAVLDDWKEQMDGQQISLPING